MFSKELQDQVILYIYNAISLQDLEEWIVPRMHRFIQNPESDDADLIAEIELQLSEYSDGLKIEAEIKAELRNLFVQAGLVEVWYNEPIVKQSTEQSAYVYREESFEIPASGALPELFEFTIEYV